MALTGFTEREALIALRESASPMWVDKLVIDKKTANTRDEDEIVGH